MAFFYKILFLNKKQSNTRLLYCFVMLNYNCSKSAQIPCKIIMLARRAKCSCLTDKTSRLRLCLSQQP